MAAPTYDATTERIYGGLPGHYLERDTEQADPDYPLKRYLSGHTDELGALELLVDRLLYRNPNDAGHTPGETSDLVDPATADVAWLPWLAQLVGVMLDPAATVAEQRVAIASASTGLKAATKAAVIAAASTALTGEQYAAVYDHSNGTAAIGEGAWHDLLIVTRADETPSIAAVLDAVRAGSKPAGVELFHAYIANYAERWGWAEATAVASNVCSFPGPTLYPTDELYPC